MTISLRQRPLARVVQGIVRANDGEIFDASDMSTMYQDAAGTIPVTAVEQPVGLMLDKSRGLMLGPELVTNGDFSNGSTGWVSTGADSATVLDGVVTLDGTTGSSSRFGTNIATVAGEFYKFSAYLKKGTDSTPTIIARDGTFPVSLGSTLGVSVSVSDTASFVAVTIFFKAVSSSTAIYLNQYTSNGGLSYMMGPVTVKSIKGYHATQSITASRPTLSARKNILLATETLATQSVTTLAATYTLSFTGTGSVTLSGTATGTLTGTGTDRVSLTFTPTAGTLTLTVSGSVTKAQLELSAVAGPYQRVTTATNYDTDERYFKMYLRFDGVDDYLNLPYMGLYANGSASIVCARDAVSQATDTYIISERSTTDTDPKYFPSRQLASAGNMDAYISDDAGTAVLDTVGSPFSGVANAVIRSIVDSGNNLKLFKNGVLAANDNYTRSGTLTLNNTTIGASVSTTTSNYASMKLYGLIVTKSALMDAQRVACERYLGRKSGVQL